MYPITAKKCERQRTSKLSIPSTSRGSPQLKGDYERSESGQ